MFLMIRCPTSIRAEPWTLSEVSPHSTQLKGMAEHHKKRGMVSSQVLLFYSSYSSLGRAVGVSRRWQNNGGDLSDLSAPIVARHIINVHLWEKSRPLPRGSCVALSSLLCWTSWIFSLTLSLWHFICMQLGPLQAEVTLWKMHREKLQTLHSTKVNLC